MAPLNLDEETKRNIILNGPRPSPLKLHNSSHTIQKQASKINSLPPKRQPIIIYTHSPKIIHTRPTDFKDLVQRLTGFSRSAGIQAASESVMTVKNDDQTSFLEENNRGFSSNHQESEASLLSEEKCDQSGGNNFEEIIKDVSLNDKELHNPYLAEMPLFTPNLSNLFRSSPMNGGLRNLDHSVFPSPGLFSLGGSISPTFMEFMKGFQDK